MRVGGCGGWRVGMGRTSGGPGVYTVRAVTEVAAIGRAQDLGDVARACARVIRVRGRAGRRGGQRGRRRAGGQRGAGDGRGREEGRGARLAVIYAGGQSEHGVTQRPPAAACQSAAPIPVAYSGLLPCLVPCARPPGPRVRSPHAAKTLPLVAPCALFLLLEYLRTARRESGAASAARGLVRGRDANRAEGIWRI